MHPSDTRTGLHKPLFLEEQFKGIVGFGEALYESLVIVGICLSNPLFFEFGNG